MIDPSKYVVSKDSTVEDVDLNIEVVLTDGRRLTDALAEELAHDTLAEARRHTLCPSPLIRCSSRLSDSRIWRSHRWFGRTGSLDAACINAVRWDNAAPRGLGSRGCSSSIRTVRPRQRSAASVSSTRRGTGRATTQVSCRGMTQSPVAELASKADSYRRRKCCSSADTRLRLRCEQADLNGAGVLCDLDSGQWAAAVERARSDEHNIGDGGVGDDGPGNLQLAPRHSGHGGKREDDDCCCAWAPHPTGRGP